MEEQGHAHAIVENFPELELELKHWPDRAHGAEKQTTLPLENKNWKRCVFFPILITSTADIHSILTASTE